MIRFLPADAPDGGFRFEAFVDEAPAGFCCFRIDGYQMEFTAVDCDDPLLADGLLRAAMNYAANRNAYTARAGAGVADRALRQLGFQGADVLTAEIPEVLMNCACGHQE
ncbi:MAG: hypothetical protein IJK64_06785 [Clostridia bacterium]|nr:hypothetical protein [Clostridia bacterium]